MATNAVVRSRIDAGVKDRAAAVLGGMGLTVSDAIRIVLTRVANENELPTS
jgi:DNA-damage-inducible protein J